VSQALNRGGGHVRLPDQVIQILQYNVVVGILDDLRSDGTAIGRSAKHHYISAK
jgi:hypothetical protein